VTLEHDAGHLRKEGNKKSSCTCKSSTEDVHLDTTIPTHKDILQRSSSNHTRVDVVVVLIAGTLGGTKTQKIRHPKFSRGYIRNDHIHKTGSVELTVSEDVRKRQE
jgi:hypothetical protein